ncbi:MAG: adenosylcobinamide-GDP ribazoletransferase, partial [Polyangiales bacterium]
MSPPLVRGVRAAFVFLTRIPVGGFPYSPEDWRWAVAHFPFVGAVVGALTAIVFVALLPVGAFAAAILAFGASALITGAFHEDGLADTSDALGGGYTREKVAAILKDSRVGTFGASALVVSFVGRAALLERLGVDALWALPFVAATARAAAVWQSFALPYVTAPEQSKSHSVVNPSLAHALVASSWAALAIALALHFSHDSRRLAIALALCALVTLVTGARYRRRLGGVTGDFL